MLENILLVRHAKPLQSGLCYGRYAVRMPDAVQAARRLHAQLLGWRRDLSTLIYTSPLPRCAELAAALSLLRPVELQADDRLMELSFGDWEGLSWDAIAAQDAHRLQGWMANWRHQAPPHGESYGQLRCRVLDFWQELVSQATGHSLRCLVTHAGVIRVLRVEIQGWSEERAWSEPVPYLQPLSLA